MYEGRSCIFGTGGWNFYPRHRVSNDCGPSHRPREKYQTSTNSVALISRLELAVCVCVCVRACACVRVCVCDT